MGFLGLFTDEAGPKRPPLPKICHTYPTMMKPGTVIPYVKKIQKMYASRDTPLEFYWGQHNFTRNQQILLYQEIQIQIAIWYIISNSFNFFWVFKNCFNELGYNLMKSAKMAALGLLKIKAFWNIGYGVITSVHDVSSKFLSRDSNYIVDVVMRQKFGNSSISMREVIITSKL